jgi:hypothetical protein
MEAEGQTKCLIFLKWHRQAEMLTAQGIGKSPNGRDGFEEMMNPFKMKGSIFKMV